MSGSSYEAGFNFGFRLFVPPQPPGTPYIMMINAVNIPSLAVSRAINLTDLQFSFALSFPTTAQSAALHVSTSLASRIAALEAKSPPQAAALKAPVPDTKEERRPVPESKEEKRLPVVPPSGPATSSRDSIPREAPLSSRKLALLQSLFEAEDDDTDDDIIPAAGQ